MTGSFMPKTFPLLPLLALLAAPAARADASEDLMNLADRVWDAHLRANPTTATSLGVPGHDHLLEDLRPAAREARAEELAGFLAEVEAIDADALAPEERITRTALRFLVGIDLEAARSTFPLWNVGPRTGPQSDLLSIPAVQPLRDSADAEALLARWRAMPAYIAQSTDNLRAGKERGLTAPRSMVERAVAMLDDLAARPVEDWSLVKIPVEGIPATWSEDDAATFTAAVTAVTRDEIAPAMREYRTFLAGEILPVAREGVGLVALPGGEALYAERIRRFTTLDLTAREIHELGLAEVERINRETRELGKTVLGTDDLEEIHRRLREDPELHFTTRDEVREKAESSLARARAAMGDGFGRLPLADCVVVPMEPHEEKYSTIAYYSRPATDGSRPGRYYINTYAPETRPRYEAEVLAYHEAIPGHHLQIAISQELTHLHPLRRNRGATAFVEGWGLYTERLAAEMGLYSGDLDRMGMLSFDSWRACRLVVDTGIHAFGWTREQAVEFVYANSCLARNNIENEVDRYISTPGQALAYKIGQRRFLALREEAQRELGNSFDIKEFHDRVLSEGAVDLTTLESLVRAWIAEKRP